MGLASSLASVILAGATMMNTAFDTIKPNMDIEGTAFLVNRQYRITDAYIPDVRRAKVSGEVREMRDDAAAALEEMFAACKEETGATLVTVSGYRSYQTQKTIYNRKVQNTGSRKKADEYVACIFSAISIAFSSSKLAGTTNSTKPYSFASCAEIRLPV